MLSLPHFRARFRQRSAPPSSSRAKPILRERPDVVLGILTTQIPNPLTTSDYILKEWSQAGLRAQSCFRVFAITRPKINITVIGRLSAHDWAEVLKRVRSAFAQV